VDFSLCFYIFSSDSRLKSTSLVELSRTTQSFLLFYIFPFYIHFLQCIIIKDLVKGAVDFVGSGPLVTVDLGTVVTFYTMKIMQHLPRIILVVLRVEQRVQQREIVINSGSMVILHVEKEKRKVGHFFN
jgi:hypothetical protein